MFSWMNPKLEIRETNRYGKGVFAKEKINKNELLTIFGGYIIMAKEELAYPEKYNDTGLQISDDFVISSGKRKECTDFFNHSCKPNAGFNGQIFLVSMRDICKGEEITFDYGMVLYRTKGIKSYKLKCLCGSKKCRGYITDNDWKNLDLQRTYKGYFQYFLSSKIENNNILK